MTTKLLIVKSGDFYVRFGEQSYTLTDMNKASVFPIDKVIDIRRKISNLYAVGLKDADIRLLTIFEEQFREDE